MAVVLLASDASAFMPSSRPSHAASKASSSALSMSAALIVQNKGGGHGEIGTLVSLMQMSCLLYVVGLRVYMCVWDDDGGSYSADGMI